MVKDRVNRIFLPPDRDRWPATVQMTRTVPVPQTAGNALINIQAPYVLHMGQEFRYSLENAFHTFNQQIYTYLII